MFSMADETILPGSAEQLGRRIEEVRYAFRETKGAGYGYTPPGKERDMTAGVRSIIDVSAADDLTWRHDVDSLTFRPNGHEGSCFIHRLAFRSISGKAEREGCEAYFRRHRETFERAARAKIRRAGLATEQNFHLTSREVRCALKEA